MDQFQDFQKYMKGVNPHGMKSGIVLIDPPDEWYAAPFCCQLFKQLHMLT
jgi:jmjN domain